MFVVQADAGGDGEAKGEGAYSREKGAVAIAVRRRWSVMEVEVVGYVGLFDAGCWVCGQH
jgi:hypothetical protein